MTNMGFIGMGNMAQAIAKGFISTGKVKAENVFAFAPNQEKLKKNGEAIGFSPCASLAELASKCDTLIAACKPYQLNAVLAELGTSLKDKVLISVAAGWVFDTFNNMLNPAIDPYNTRIQCIMPNTPAMVGQGVMLFEKKNSLKAEELEQAVELFKALGIVEFLDTSLMGIGGAISGCGPAFMDMIMEAYADAAVKYGIARDTAYRLVSQTMAGSAILQQKTGSHPGVLKDAVCSPNGTTICGVDALEKAGLRGALISSIDAIMNKKKN